MRPHQWAVAWTEAGLAFTYDFESLVAWLARELNKTAVEALAKIAWASVGNIVARQHMSGAPSTTSVSMTFS
jgi:hypothetical protein